MKRLCERCGWTPGFRDILVRYAGFGEVCDPCAVALRREEEDDAFICSVCGGRQDGAEHYDRRGQGGGHRCVGCAEMAHEAYLDSIGVQ